MTRPDLDPCPWTTTPHGDDTGYRREHKPLAATPEFHFAPRAGYSQNPGEYQ